MPELVSKSQYDLCTLNRSTKLINEFKKLKRHGQNLIWKITGNTILEYEIVNISNVIPSYFNVSCEGNARHSLI